MATWTDGFNTDTSVTLVRLPGPMTDLLGGTGPACPSSVGSPRHRQLPLRTAPLATMVVVVTVEPAPLKTALNGPLATVLKLLGPQTEEQPAPLISLGPKIVLTIGDVCATGQRLARVGRGRQLGRWRLDRRRRCSTGGGGSGGGSGGGGDTLRGRRCGVRG